MSDKKPKYTRANLADLLYRLVNQEDRDRLTRPQADRLVDHFIAGIQFALSKGRTVELRGLGTFGVRDIPPGKAKNPKSGELIEYGARETVFFRPSKKLKKLVNWQQPVEIEGEETKEETKKENNE